MAAIVITLSVLEDYSPIASFLKCDILYLWCIGRSPASAELLVLFSHWSRT